MLEGPELRTIFLGMDQWREELLDMPGSGKNPFLDQRVREAFAHAIDLDAHPAGGDARRLDARPD